MSPNCYNFIEGLKNIKFEKKGNHVEEVEFKDLGFSLKLEAIKGLELNTEDDVVIYRRNKQNYPIISQLHSREVIGKLENNDILIAISNADLSKLNDDEIDNLLDQIEVEKFVNVLIERKDKKLNLKLKKHFYQKEYRGFYFVLNSINEIDLKNSKVKFSGFLSSVKEYSEILGWDIIRLAKETISWIDEDGTLRSNSCLNIPYDYAKENRMPISGETFTFFDLISEDKDKVTEVVDIEVFQDTTTDEENDMLLNITYTSEGEIEIKNKFNLTSFPFDKQKIIISMVDGDEFDYVMLSPYLANYQLLEFNQKQIKIPGWDITDIKFTMGNNLELSGLVFNQATIEIDIERQSFYYIFKIIFPIVLILLICWSSVWLDPKEVESKLTITIVCLLSLIAYNFVIDNELPKLEYLTIMDWIILASYLFAAAPNMLAIVTFQMSNKIKYKKLNLKIDQISKRYGITSYILLIFIVVIINVSIVPDNTINALSWAMMR